MPSCDETPAQGSNAFSVESWNSEDLYQSYAGQQKMNYLQ